VEDPFNLRRFIEAQEPVYGHVRSELAEGEKRTHWMWFIFPQISGLGFSAMSRKYEISGWAEAQAYLAHPVLGTRLRECVMLVDAVENKSAVDIFGPVDARKFRSCMTLFAAVADGQNIFDGALQKYFTGEEDRETLDRL
jgi:uncharacterized protein (DUF1810 family)